jgi:hypothetical protein
LLTNSTLDYISEYLGYKVNRPAKVQPTTPARAGLTDPMRPRLVIRTE